MDEQRAKLLTFLAGLSAAAPLLMGAGSGIVFSTNYGTGSRYAQVSVRSSSISLQGYVENPNEAICVYQQQRNDSTMAVLGCYYPSPTPYPDTCGATWYHFDVITAPLNTADAYWFGKHDPANGLYEYTGVFVTRNTSNSGLYTTTEDWLSGPSENGTCWRGGVETNTARSPITVFRGGRPASVNCAGSVRSFAGCPFTCNLPLGCDFLTGAQSYEFWNASHRINASGQDTALTEWDQVSSVAGYSPPPGEWYYGWDTDGYYVVMRRDEYYGLDTLNLRRGENWRNVKVEAWAKNEGDSYYYRYSGIVGRWKDASNYFIFKQTEYGGDYAWLERTQAGSTALIGSVASWWPFDMNNSWTRLGLEIKDLGSYVNGGFVPSGNCSVAGSIDWATVTSVASTPCSFAPYGRNGMYANFNFGLQFYDFDETPLNPIVQ